MKIVVLIIGRVRSIIFKNLYKHSYFNCLKGFFLVNVQLSTKAVSTLTKITNICLIYSGRKKIIQGKNITNTKDRN